jgi:hypothetical protein
MYAFLISAEMGRMAFLRQHACGGFGEAGTFLDPTCGVFPGRPGTIFPSVRSSRNPVALTGYRGGLEMKTSLLELEGAIR